MKNRKKNKSKNILKVSLSLCFYKKNVRGKKRRSFNIALHLLHIEIVKQFFFFSFSFSFSFFFYFIFYLIFHCFVLMRHKLSQMLQNTLFLVTSSYREVAPQKGMRARREFCGRFVYQKCF